MKKKIIGSVLGGTLLGVGAYGFTPMEMETLDGRIPQSIEWTQIKERTEHKDGKEVKKEETYDMKIKGHSVVGEKIVLQMDVWKDGKFLDVDPIEVSPDIIPFSNVEQEIKDYVYQYGTSPIPDAANEIAKTAGGAFTYAYGDLIVNVDSVWVKDGAVWFNATAYRNGKKVELDIPYGYAGINILGFDSKSKTVRDLLNGTIDMQDKEEFQVEFKKRKTNHNK